MKEIKHIYIINPAAGKKDRTMEVASAVKAFSMKQNMRYEIHITERPKHATEIVKKAALANAGFDLRFYACGGDGTLNEVATAVADIENAAVTHFPTGTGNDYLKTFGDQLNRFFSLQELHDGEIIDVDYIRSDCGNAVNVLSVGLDARIAACMPKYKRLPLLGGVGAYLVSAFENVMRGMSRTYCVNIDGVDYDGCYTMICAANGRYYGGGFNPVPEASINDGILNILLVKAIGRLTAAKVVDVYKKGRYKELPQYIVPVLGREVTVFTQDGSDMEINLDGEIVRSGRISFRVVEGGLRFIVPAGVKALEIEQKLAAVQN